MSERPLARDLAAAVVLASGGVLVAVVTWLLSNWATEQEAIPSSTGILLAVGLLCLAGLTLRRSPALAWFSVTFAAVFATRAPAALQAALRDHSIDEAWLAAASIAAVTALAATVVAALYATRSDRLVRPVVRVAAWGLVGWLAAASAATVLFTMAGFDEDRRIPLSVVLFLPIRAWGSVVVGLALLGIAGDVLPAAQRTMARQAEPDARTGPAAWSIAFIDELMGRADARRVAAELERRRLAGELHAQTIPALRDALRDLEGGRPVDGIAAELRAIAADLEGVVIERRDPILESLGLVSALEGLAERVEARTRVAVDLIVLDGTDGGRPPAPIEAAAFRSAALAVDNAVRHAAPARIEIRVTTGAAVADLEVVDDGAGIDHGAEARALAAGRQGLAEIRRLAVEAGARSEVGRSPAGGTSVRFRWTSRA